MKLLAITFIIFGLIGSGFSFVKYKQQAEWEHWQEKFKWMILIGLGTTLTVIGAIILIFSLTAA